VNTDPVRPSVRHARTRENNDATRTEPGSGQNAPRTPRPDKPSAGARLLLSIGLQHPELLLSGPALRDQGQAVTAMLETGWSPEQVRRIVTSRPLPGRIRTSVDAIVAARLHAAHAYPPPAACPDADIASTSRPAQAALAGHRPVREALAYRALVECAGCGLPGCAPGEDLCPSCLGWLLCQTCVGPTPRRAHPDGDGRCTACATVSTSPSGGITS
jgi:hypothetical protein